MKKFKIIISAAVSAALTLTSLVVPFTVQGASLVPVGLPFNDDISWAELTEPAWSNTPESNLVYDANGNTNPAYMISSKNDSGAVWRARDGKIEGKSARFNTGALSVDGNVCEGGKSYTVSADITMDKIGDSDSRDEAGIRFARNYPSTWYYCLCFVHSSYKLELRKQSGSSSGVLVLGEYDFSATEWKNICENRAFTFKATVLQDPLVKNTISYEIIGTKSDNTRATVWSGTYEDLGDLTSLEYPFELYQTGKGTKTFDNISVAEYTVPTPLVPGTIPFEDNMAWAKLTESKWFANAGSQLVYDADSTTNPAYVISNNSNANMVWCARNGALVTKSNRFAPGGLTVAPSANITDKSYTVSADLKMQDIGNSSSKDEGGIKFEINAASTSRYSLYFVNSTKTIAFDKRISGGDGYADGTRIATCDLTGTQWENITFADNRPFTFKATVIKEEGQNTILYEVLGTKTDGTKATVWSGTYVDDNSPLRNTVALELYSRGSNEKEYDNVSIKYYVPVQKSIEVVNGSTGNYDVKITNPSGYAITADSRFIYAYYNALNELVGAGILPMNTAVDNVITMSVPINSTVGVTGKVFIWEGGNSIAPLSEAIPLEIAQ